jgi:hypothetical protein
LPQINEIRRAFPWVGNNVVVIGGAHVMAVARQVDSLREVATQVPDGEVLSLDATGDNAP